ncbi:Proline-rich receptor-like protein kinase PERK4 [Striga hermonthica]|uniref:non-specific serine/threonine protein kinase n=1 Tax=Striga hermonthica TaxID=68872 RepID=A0A9N7ME53_STRHE|nr:Proline-rich receptor-like protein kinase PERK4 [Striga hermonthica]
MSSPEESPPSNSTSTPPPPPSSSDSPPPPSSDTPSPPPPPSESGGGDSSSSPSPNSSPSPPPPDSDDSGGRSSPPPPPPPRGDSSPSHPPPPPPPVRSSGGDGRGNTPQISNGSNNNDNNNNNNNSNDNSNQTAVIAGAAAGAGLLILIVIVFMVTCCRRKKRKPRNNYYTSSNWQNDGRPNWQNNGPPTDRMGKPPPPPPGSAGVSSEHSWQIAPPPPPPPMMSSSELSSAGFSGPNGAALPPPHPAMALGFNQSSFTYDDLSAATAGFAQSNLLGQGGFGYVHKGVLPNGKEIAVKSLKANSGQGEREFQAEVDIISRVHHRHLVSLVGYCIAGTQRMLVYEYVPNKTLEYHLHGSGCPTMDWPTRLKIALGSAKGFAYLHEDCHPRIIHRDIKAANILLDLNFEAKVADFGLAKLSSDNFTHVSTRIMGTFGYLAPEYASSGKLTEKSDVYSYGIMLLELIAGRRPVDINSDDDGLVDWARPILVRATEGGSFDELVDPRLGNNYDHQEMLRAVLSAAACIRHSARRRPKMSQVVRALEGDVSLEDLNGGLKTAHIAMFGSSGDSEIDLKKLGVRGLNSQEFNSSEDGHTGEFLRTSGGNSREFGSSLQAGRARSPQM